VSVTLEEITDANREAVLGLRVAPGQEMFVADVARSLAGAAEYPQALPWYRAIVADGQPVGFVMVSWNPDPEPPDPAIITAYFLWRLLIDERHQGRGYGAAALRQVAGLVRADGATELLTSYVPGEGGPAGFYRRLGFEPTGELDPAGEIITRLTLPPA
jgi:diamine N-acetyltransferase